MRKRCRSFSFLVFFSLDHFRNSSPQCRVEVSRGQVSLKEVPGSLHELTPSISSSLNPPPVHANYSHEFRLFPRRTCNHLTFPPPISSFFCCAIRLIIRLILISQVRNFSFVRRYSNTSREKIRSIFGLKNKNCKL